MPGGVPAEPRGMPGGTSAQPRQTPKPVFKNAAGSSMKDFAMSAVANPLTA